MRQLHNQYSQSGDAEILIVYQKEPHPGQLAFTEIAQPESFEQRCDLASKMKDEYELPMTVLVDSMEDQSRALFSELPSPAFIIDAQGVIRAKFPWADAETIGPAVQQVIQNPVVATNDPAGNRSPVNPAVWIAIGVGVALPLFLVLVRSKSKNVDETSDR